jgi:hypothetical protein
MAKHDEQKIIDWRAGKKSVPVIVKSTAAGRFVRFTDVAGRHKFSTETRWEYVV